MFDQIADRDAPGQAPGLEADAIGPFDPQLQRVLYGDNPVILGQQLDQRIQQRRFPGSGPARNQDVSAGPQQVPGGVVNRWRHRTLRDELAGRECAVPEAPDGDGDLRRSRGHTDGDAGAVVEPRVQDGGDGRIETQRAGNLDGGAIEGGCDEQRRVLLPDGAPGFRPTRFVGR